MFHWELANELCKNFTHIYIEDLNVQIMKEQKAKNNERIKHIRKDFRKYAVSTFITRLTQKAKEYILLL